MNFVRKIIARFIELLAAQVLGDIEKQLRPSFHALQTHLGEIERALVPPFLATVLKNEMQNLNSLPLPLFQGLPELTVIGSYAEDFKTLLPSCQIIALSHWQGFVSTDRPERPLSHVLFLDEYYFIRTMERLRPEALQIAESIMVATRFDYLPEARCRLVLHQLGFMEIALVTVDGLTNEPRTYAVSHASPVTCEPLFIDARRPALEHSSPALWLVARRVPLRGRPEWPHA